MEQISKKQAAAMLILFEIGSTPIFELAYKSKQDAWIVIIMSILCGLALLLLFLYLTRMLPGQSLAEMLGSSLGAAGKALAVLYSLFFSYECFRNLRDIGDLTIQTVLTQTPMSLIMLVILLLSAYTLYKGLESFFLLAELLVPLIVFAYAVLMLLFVFSDKLHFERLLPLFTTDWKLLLRITPNTTWFPFGQTVIFLVFWRYVRDAKGLSSSTVRAYWVSSSIIFVMNVFNLAVLGPALTGMVTIPLLQATQMIEIAQVFEHFDVMVFMLFYMGIFFKTTLWYMAATLTLGSIFGKDQRVFILPVGAVIYAVVFVPPSWQAHLESGYMIANNLLVNPLFILFIPGILLLATLVQRRFRQQKA